MMGIYFKILACSILFVVLQHLVKVIYMLEFHKTVYNHTPGPCTLVADVDYGSEDIATLDDGKAFITSGAILPSIASPHLIQYHKDNNVKGRIFLFDFKDPSKGAMELEIKGNLNSSSFKPHGIGHWHDAKTDRTVLFVVSHRGKEDSIEKFEYKSGQKYIQHIHTYTDQSIHVIINKCEQIRDRLVIIKSRFESMFPPSFPPTVIYLDGVNDVAATGADSFYFSNYFYFKTRGLVLLESFLLLPLCNINYFDGKEYGTVADGMNFPNGIALSKDKKYLYVATTVTQTLKVFRTHEGGALTFIQEIHLYTHPDNPTVDPFNGNVLVGAHPITYQASAHLEDPRLPAPSQVLMLQVKDGRLSNMTELYSDDGGVLWGSSVASLYGNKMLIGTVFHKLLYCDVRVL